ncbi:hypothetical protein Pfo_020403 [Paulownia fortunei]|nr:hypothetical protein Pfo_020403 [Paulownia fortunei]
MNSLSFLFWAPTVTSVIGPLDGNFKELIECFEAVARKSAMEVTYHEEKNEVAKAREVRGATKFAKDGMKPLLMRRRATVFATLPVKALLPGMME